MALGCGGTSIAAMTTAIDSAPSAPLMRVAQSVPHHVMNYIGCDLDPELTLSQWRRVRAAVAYCRRLQLRVPRRRASLAA
jgi:hypothetical protein